MTRLRTYELERPPQRPAAVDPQAVVTVLRVPPECEGMRLDRFVQSQLKRTSRTRAQVIIKNSAFSSEGQPKRPSERVRGEQHICLWRPPWDEDGVDRDLPILFEDEALLAIDKPALVPVHPTARYFRSTVVKLLEVVRPGQIQRLAHRLDRETSGVLLLSKTSEADRHVKRQFAGIDPHTGRASEVRWVEKTYVAIVHGHPAFEQRDLDQDLCEDAGSTLRVKMRVCEPGRGLSALTRVRVIERRRDRRRGPFALVECELFSGRQHQIRVHLAAAGHPVVGDKLYGGDDRLHRRGSDGTLTDEDLERLLLPRQALHAQRLALEHPLEPGRRVHIEAPLPVDMATFLASLTE